MTCTPLDFGNGVTGFACSRGAKRPVLCSRCKTNRAERLCDYPLRGARAGGTCSAPLCVQCACVDMKSTKTAQLDYCPPHAQQIMEARSWLDSVIAEESRPAARDASLDERGGHVWDGDTCVRCGFDYVDAHGLAESEWPTCEERINARAEAENARRASSRRDASTVPIGAKVAYVKSQRQTRDHHCHWPGCEQQVPPAMWGCRQHWGRLPKYLRDKIWESYRPGQERTMTPSKAYVEAAREVQNWICAHDNDARLFVALEATVADMPRKS